MFFAWLMTNRQFLKEHDELFDRQTVIESGVPQPFPSFSHETQSPVGLQEDSSKSAAAVANTVQEFCRKWRLARLAGPFLPEPLQPQFPVLLPGLAVDYVSHGGVLMFIPDIYPIQNRADLEGIIEDALRGMGMPSHLKEWSEIAASNNTGKKAFTRYARLFDVQHICRVLFARHTNALQQSVIHLERAIGTFLDVSADTIHKDLGFITKQLGSNWMMRQNPLMSRVETPET